MLVLALMLVSTGAALAQMGSTRLTAQVPFDFVLRDKAVPAGELTVQSAIMSGVLLIQNADAKVSVLSVPQMDETKKPAGSCVLVFHRYNNRYFLSEIKIEGSNIAYRIPESKAEAELRAQNLTANKEVILASLK
jgi:hypothetical protein